MPELKSFLKEGEVEEYENIEVTFIPGRRAVLTIYEDEKEIEKITLSNYKTKDKMHELLQSKGFTRTARRAEAAETTGEEKVGGDSTSGVTKKVEEEKGTLLRDSDSEKGNVVGISNKEIEAETQGTIGPLIKHEFQLMAAGVAVLVAIVFLRRKKDTKRLGSKLRR